ncbi:MAG: AraC family transcriptional regulator [Phaeodactylibacter sp.]|nr:AraC family transcriptional regulator [Phaeodactylibacter sp.]
MDLNLIISFLIAGGVLLLAFLKLSNTINVNEKGNRYFGYFLLLYATFWLDEAIVSASIENNLHFIALKGFTQFLAPLAFYISIWGYANPHTPFKRKDVRFLIVPIAFLGLLYSKPFLDEAYFRAASLTLPLLHGLFYCILAYITIQKHQKNIESFVSNKEPIDLNWIKYIIYGFLGSIVILIVYNLLGYTRALNLYMNLYFFGLIYMVAYFSVRQREIYPEAVDIETIVEAGGPDSSLPGKRKLLDDDALAIQKAKLLELMEEEEPYLDSELNLVGLSERLSLSTHQLSYVINNGFGENFFQFINKYKVKKAEALLQDPHYDQYTILAIGFESGFNSKTAFNTTFKKMTSYTPSEFRKMRSAL